MRDKTIEVIEICPASFLLRIPSIGVKWIFNTWPDISKFLVQKNLDCNGVVCMDLSMQGGYNCNLAEFPLLYAMYVSGMVFRGEKPCLIGTPQQLRLASEGFRRGLYGFYDTSEMEGCDLSAAEMRGLMGEIVGLASDNRVKSDQELFELIPLMELEKSPSSATTQCYRGLRIWKKASNVFCVLWQGEQLTIDCNLGVEEVYTPPLVLDIKRIPYATYQVIDTGEEDGFSTKSSMHTVIQWQDKIISIDLPMNAAYLLKQVSISPTEIDAVVFTHNHDDHVGELSMLLSMGKKVTIICPKIIWKSILLKASYLFGMSINELTSYFDYRPIRYGKENEYDYSGLRIEAHPSIHSVPCAIYRIRGRVGQAWKVYSHLSDILNFHHCQILLDKGYITRQRFNSYRAFLLRPATVKKVDVGTVDGKEKFSVHGSWKDFSQDTSDQIVLAHIQRIKLNQAATMTLGQFATVGSAKVLGDDSRRSDHTQSKKRALRYLAKYFFELKPEAKQTQKSRVDKELDDYLGKLVNSDILIIQPNTPFIKISDSATFVDLVISGIGSIWIPKGTEWQQIAKVHPGDIVGEIGVLLGKPRNASVYADTYMRVLRMPASLFRETSAYAGLFMASNEGILQKVWRCREIVQSSRLFGDEVPIYLQNKIARYAREITLNKGNLILSQKDEESSIFLGTNPALFAMKNDHLKREKGCFKLPVFGERGFMTGEPDRYQIVACKEANMLQLDREKFSWVREIPLFKLRLKELVEQRKILCGETSPPVNFS